MSKELQKKETKDVAFTSNDKEMMAQMEKDAEDYVDDTAEEDLALPRIKLLQALSPEVSKGSPEYNEKAETGDFLNTLDSSIIKGDKGFFFVPVKRKIVYIEWLDRKQGGGMVQHFGEDSSAYNNAETNEKGAKIGQTKDSEIVKTYEVYGVFIDLEGEKYSEAILSFQKSAVKKMKKWNTLMRCFCDKSGKPFPEYAAIYKITSIPESNKQGQSYFNYEISYAGYTLAIPTIGKMIYEKSKEWSNAMKQEKIQYANYANSIVKETPENNNDLM